MHVDKPRGHDQARRVDHTRGIACDLADRSDPVALDGDVTVEPRIARAIDDFSMA